MHLNKALHPWPPLILPSHQQVSLATQMRSRNWQTRNQITTINPDNRIHTPSKDIPSKEDTRLRRKCRLLHNMAINLHTPLLPTRLLPGLTHTTSNTRTQAEQQN